ncbi:dihydroneopterin aldolase [Nannocystis pusilla]|uniref:Dihydroneopterin aldolase n=1 Tax=Nannocystis pusilla TaxID=889268 RepID=A0ABS7TKH9_9BACT|nr:dihydroneopterin aldolase [Nannocystis pusilla]MBZ5708716.1 dihydroneopterin aldolase [Nannocystis pusilla]
MTRALARRSPHDLQLACELDLFDHERAAPRPLRLDVTLRFDAATPDVHLSSDGSRLLGELRFVLVSARFARLESAAEAVAAWLLLPPSPDVPRPQVDAVEVRLSTRAAGTLELHRTRRDFEFVTETKAFGFVDVVFEAEECGVYRERLHPHSVLPTHVHHHLDETELVLGDGLLLQGAPVLAGTAHTWPRAFPHRYDNPTDRQQSFLCIDRPAFIPTDEIEVDVSVELLRRTGATRFF